MTLVSQNTSAETDKPHDTNVKPPIYLQIAGGNFRSVLFTPGTDMITVKSYLMRETPVTNIEFLAFVASNPDWSRKSVSPLFADNSYLVHWKSAEELSVPQDANSPVTNVSWFAAQAYCQSEGARLPTWSEWEYAAAADATHADARQDPAWRASILAWYSVPSDRMLPSVGGTANLYGIRDLHGLIWEWVDDFNSLLVSADSREQGDPDKQKFCGAGALDLKDRENYAILMRIALLSSLQASYTTNNLGFRCARSIDAKDKGINDEIH